ncbi:hypothetical protein [Shewanella gaetbuli]|uniref:Plastocyanin n=1 Tax=Shewanella gaetbuli TaxID=220752 RepID=A0A9X2CN02_9GAMM|nr:hypothetical protein [Shewanella gaetbuli]MCL1144184.1 hypothetical protein [Shewanella gaetbuli]
MKLTLASCFNRLILVATISVSAQINATTIKGTITFVKKPPLVGIAYIPIADISPTQETVVIDQIDKQFTTNMAVISSGGEVTFKNSDNVEHNVFANDAKQSAKFDVGLMQPGGEKKIKVDWQQNSIVRVGCKIHPKMRTYLSTINTPFHRIIEFEKGQQQYQFSLNQIPDNADIFSFKIPKYDAVNIDLLTGSSWEVDITKNGKIRGHITIIKE